MSTNSPVANQLTAPIGGLDALGLEHCIFRRRDGVYADPTMLGKTFLTAFDHILQGNFCFTDIDYALVIKALYGCGPDLPRSGAGEGMVRFATDVAPFSEARRALYKAVKINDGMAEYYFEPVFMRDPDNPDGNGIPTALDVDEFIADMWGKGIRFGIDVAAVREAIASGKAERVTIARRLDPAPGADAHIIEVSDDIHRSDAPRQLANGKLDLMSFQNRFPQIRQNVRLLKKVPRVAGVVGFELSGIPIEPATPADIDLAPMAGLGTEVQRNADGEFLVSIVPGFLSVDPATKQISIGDKIVSREGVSTRTTGNLQLTGDYEEFGEVQEKRVLEGEGITIHADVFGEVVSRGGTVQLNRNLVGGSARNARGDIRIKGIASGAVVQASSGEVVMNRAENCVISGTRVTLEHAVNCEIIADDVEIGQAEGCAIAARRIVIGSVAPRKQSEMLLYVLRPDSGKIDEVLRQIAMRVAEFDALVARHKAELERMTSEPEVRKYVMLAAKIRKQELTLTPEQEPQFQKMALAVGPALKAIAKVSLDVKAAETERQAGAALVAQLQQQRSDSEGVGSVRVRMVQGDTIVRVMGFNPDGSSTYDIAPKDIKTRLRTAGAGGERIFAGSQGTIDWTSES
ncbi:FapA family protein [Massilia sp. R2A-15]|uniref:flagellar assembly protein A n=1 Tax=Massilia sp. R2A-15 TaxID=3064278 RepID=UPI002735B5B0|nr:flagellar assembly protein A [Massilia sp. R2A-15]WLI87453.1 FapA family protein [Massilia sp. R2A-15]